MKGQTLGFDELMIINPSGRGGGYMFYQPLQDNELGQPPEVYPEMSCRCDL